MWFEVFKSCTNSAILLVCNCLNISPFLVYLCMHIPGSLEQTIPEGNLPVCANEQLTYTCGSDFGTIVWQQGVNFHEFSASLSQVNASETVGPFFVVLIDVNGSVLISTATSFMTNSSLDGTFLQCFDGANLLGRDVDVAGTFV